MNILGINVYHADVAAVLVRDGQLVAALEEERFRRIKHYAGFPEMAIRECLAMGGIRGEDVDVVAVSRNPRANLMRKAAYVMTHLPNPALIGDRLQNRRKLQDLKTPLADALSLPADHLPRIRYVEHHPAHLASAFFVSPFDEAAVCAIDGFGDFVSTSFAHGAGNRLDVFDKICFPHSLGMLYTAVTQYLGFLSYGDEFKVMGLAPYGKPRFTAELSRLVELLPGGRFQLNLDYFRHWSEGVEMEWEEGYPRIGVAFSSQLERLLGPARGPDDPLTSRHEDIAHSLQAVYETCAFHVLNGLWERTKSPRLCLAGGCAMNSVANGKIRANTPFREIYVQPAASDNGTALGAAYYVWRQILDNPRTFVMNHALWGPSYDGFDIAHSGEFDSIRFDRREEMCAAAARLIAEGNVVGWFQGRMEWGARALGNRSILADPRRADMRERINARIKYREKFRPFAPSILEDAAGEYFVDPLPDPFMQQVYPIREEKRSVIPAVTHVDGTGRLQTVNREQNPLYHALISEFAKLTGVPVLLNTSFNENEPIVDTPEQAFDCFARTKMDALFIGNTLIVRNKTDMHTETERTSNALPV